MAAVVGKYAAKKMLGKQMDKYRDKDVVPYVSRSLSRQFAKRKRIPKKKKNKDLDFALRCNNSLVATRRACIPFFILHRNIHIYFHTIHSSIHYILKQS